MINLFSTYYHLLSPSSYTESMIVMSTAYIYIYFFFSPRKYDFAVITHSAATQKPLASSSAKYVNRNASVSRNLQTMVHIQTKQLILRLFVLSTVCIWLQIDRPGFTRVAMLMSFFYFENIFPQNFW